MNVENDSAEPACVNLELSLGYSNHCISSRSSGQGAGVNATASRVDMTFVTSGPLAELVWSPLNGLSLKCADCSFVAKSTPIIWDVGPSILVNDGNLVKSQASFVVTPRNSRGELNIGHFAGKSGDMEEVNSMEKAKVADDNRKESTSKNDEGEMHGGNDIDSKDQKTMDFLSPKTDEHENKDLPTPIPMPRASSPKERKDSIFNIENKNESKLDCSTSVLPLERLEFTAENELPFEKDVRRDSEDTLLRGKSVQIETSPAHSKTLVLKDKGKGKDLSEGDACKILPKEEDSGESVESCSSVGLLAAGKKRERFEQNLSLGSKRVRNQIEENPISASLGGHHSSFINWISNMMKVSNRLDEKEEPSLALALTNPQECHVSGDKNIVPYNEKYSQHGNGDMGFRTFFQSIYCPKQKEIETKATIENTPIGEANELVSAEIVMGPSATPISCRGYLACADMADGRNSSSSETRAGEKIINNSENKFDNPENLWITRFSRKSHEHLVNLDRPSKKADDKSNEMSTLASSNLKNKGVMASVFAKRIDALKLIAPSDVKLTSCFYCGKIGHDLRNCSDVSETDRVYLIRNISSSVEIEETHSCLCLWCFQLDHWAISCPKAQMFKQKSLSVQLEIGNAVASTLNDDSVKGETLQEVPKGMFDVIRKLRLSRTDIIKWMNSHSSLSNLGGYFLRLRLGKWEKAPCRTGYYAARIKGEQKEKQIQGSKGPIAVDIVGESFLVENQHISNQDFQESELTEWWITTLKSGAAIPSADELKVKLEEKIRLGF